MLTKKDIRIGQTKHKINRTFCSADQSEKNVCKQNTFFLIFEEIRRDSRSDIETAYVYFYIHVSSTQLALRHLLILVERARVPECFVAPDFM